MDSIPLIVGKWYVLDYFSPEPIAGPFDSKAEAENERTQLNIAEDCTCGKLLNNPKEKPQ